MLHPKCSFKNIFKQNQQMQSNVGLISISSIGWVSAASVLCISRVAPDLD